MQPCEDKQDYCKGVFDRPSRTRGRCLRSEKREPTYIATKQCIMYESIQGGKSPVGVCKGVEALQVFSCFQNSYRIIQKG